jgi:hypothetical protein
MRLGRLMLNGGIVFPVYEKVASIVRLGSHDGTLAFH